ncbi:decarboxylase yanB [Colletotrichum spaethianum]|uniref:6-methylsalicylate decarboxylase n=1 Tax=Colletotrichum spaethianum TaxID=700344 RepID=A0AA37UPV5_9PEZI|nr:decarboxylase yanB [Colletotrichum spaethianum]GKT47717.1 decarboxylase yanB [Colletotrichum spaethianum]
MSKKIDTHIHVLPPAYVEALEVAGGDPSGFQSPEWSLAILSVSAPGVSIAGPGEAGRKLVRTLNDYLAEQTQDPGSQSRLGFFGALPDWQDVQGTTEELDFLFGQQKLCFGVIVFTSYGGKLLGDPVFKPIWQRLQAHKALVFLHPTVLDVTPKLIASTLPQPILDYPLATTRTAVDLVMSGTLHASPDVDVILSHAGGALPFLANRVEGCFQVPSVRGLVSMDYATAKLDFARFYYDTALSTSPAQLNGLLDYADLSHIVFGSDFPYCPESVVEAQSRPYEEFVAEDPRGSMIAPDALRRNAMALLKKHVQNRDLNWDFKA